MPFFLVGRGLIQLTFKKIMMNKFPPVMIIIQIIWQGLQLSLKTADPTVIKRKMIIFQLIKNSNVHAVILELPMIQDLVLMWM